MVGLIHRNNTTSFILELLIRIMRNYVWVKLVIVLVAYIFLCLLYSHRFVATRKKGSIDPNSALCLKKKHKNKQHLFLAAYIFIKHSQNVCLIDVTLRYGRPFDFIAFFLGIFIHY